MGSRTSVTANVPGVPAYSGLTSYAYDAKQQLTQEQSARSGGYTNGFAHDAAGNITSFKGVLKTYNTDNQDNAQTFDGNGNPTTYKGTTCSYDPENRLTAYGATLTAGYRADGLRAWKQVAAGRTYFLYDGIFPVCELSSAGAVTATNTFGANGLLSRNTSAGSVFYSFDHHGSIAQRHNNSGTALASYMFDAYGTRGSTDGSTDPFTGYGAQWGYYTDWETGLQSLAHRYYDPATGRFLNRDPISYAGGINLYGYVTNNPQAWIDPEGLTKGFWPKPKEPSLLEKICGAVDNCLRFISGMIVPNGTNNCGCDDLGDFDGDVPSEKQKFGRGSNRQERKAIEHELEKRLGRKPTKDEINKAHRQLGGSKKVGGGKGGKRNVNPDDDEACEAYDRAAENPTGWEKQKGVGRGGKKWPR